MICTGYILCDSLMLICLPSLSLMSSSQSRFQRMRIFLSTCTEIVMVFAHRGRFFLIPLVIVLLMGSIFLIAVDMIPMFSPFVYALF